jgi:glyoxylase-like metal-dependent hydrolase (beta-lactamase superfamily II)
MKLNSIAPPRRDTGRPLVRPRGVIAPLHVCIGMLLAVGCGRPASAQQGGPPGAEPVVAGMSILRGGVNTVVFERNGRRLVVTPGDVTAIPGRGPIDWVLVTHHHRDEASGAAPLLAMGAKLVVPAAETHLFSDADAFWRAQEHYLVGFRPSRFTLRESVPVTRSVKEGDVLEWEGLKFTVIETPGHTDGSVTYLAELDGARIAFTGDLIYASGRMWELYSLQERLGGMQPHLGFGATGEQVKASLNRVLAWKPTHLVPSHGAVMTDPASAVEQMNRNFDRLMDNYLTTVGWPDFGRMGRNAYDAIWARVYPGKKLPRLPPLPPTSYPPWIRNVTLTSQAIIADNGAAFLSDCGLINGQADVIAKLREMIGAGEIRRVEAIWPTHYHADHTDMIARARQAFRSEVYIQREMAEIMEFPQAYGMPYMASVPVKADHIMADRQTIDWHGIKLTFYHFPGQTLYHGGLLAEKAGFKAFFTGDSWANWGIEDYCPYFRCFLGEDRGYDKCLKILLECKPDILVQAHRGPMAVTEDYLRRTLAKFQEREGLCRALLPHDDPNFGLDPYWARAFPYRQLALRDAPVDLEVRITNHALKPKTFGAELRVPENWSRPNGAGAVTIPARSEGVIRLRAATPVNPAKSRAVLGIAITRDGQAMGELAEAIVDFPSQSGL